jgi:hypothetical protein
MATDIFGNPLDEEELRRQYLHQMAMGIAPHPARTKGLAIPPSVDYNQVMQDWSDPVMLSAPAFDTPRPTNVQTSGIAPTWDTNAVAFGNQGVRSFNYSRPSPLPVTPPGTMNMKDFIDKYGPVQSGTRDAYYTNDGVRNAAGDLVSTDTTFDPTGGLAATDPNLQGVTPYSQASLLGDITSVAEDWVADQPLIPNNPISVLGHTGLVSDTLNYDAGPAVQNIFDAIMPTASAQPFTFWDGDKGPQTRPSGWGVTNTGGIYGTEPVIGADPEPSYGDVGMGDTGLGHPGLGMQGPQWDTSAVSSVASTPMGGIPSGRTFGVPTREVPYGVGTGMTKEEMLDAGWKESTTGGLFPWGPSEEQMQDPDRVADMEKDTQIDTFSTMPTETVSTGSGGGFRPGFGTQRDTYAPEDMPAVPAKPAGPTRAELKAAAVAQRKANLAAWLRS